MVKENTDLRYKNIRGYKLAKIFLKTQRKFISFEKINIKEPRKFGVYDILLFRQEDLGEIIDTDLELIKSSLFS